MILARLIDQVTIRVVIYAQESRKVDGQITNKVVIIMLAAMSRNVNNVRTNDGMLRKIAKVISPKPLRPFCMIVCKRLTASSKP